MTRDEIEGRLWRGEKFSDIFPYETAGQECTIFKAPWPEGEILKHCDDVIYVPDICLNHIDGIVDKEYLSSDEVHELLGCCYTVNDFLYQAYGNVKAAKDLYSVTDWQHPSIDDLTDCTDNNEAKELWGETWNDMEARVNGINSTREELYRLYQLEWMARHGYSVRDILNDRDPGRDFEENGFNGSLWACFDEFLDNEYQDDGYICGLYAYVKDYVDKEKGKELERWYQTDIGNYHDMCVQGYISEDTELVPLLRKDR